METPDAQPLFDDELAAGLDAPGPGRRRLEAEVFPAYVPRCRWFGGKARAPQRFTVRDVVQVGEARTIFVAVDYADGASEIYQLPVAVVRGEAAGAVPREAILARGAGVVLCDALVVEAARASIFRVIAEAGVRRGEAGELRGVRGAALDPAAEGPSRLLKVEQSNSAVIYGESIFLKLYRKLEAGVNPDAEITRLLSERHGFRHVPPFAGALEYRTAAGESQVLALAQGLVPNRGDAWSWALGEVAEFFARVTVAPGGDAALPGGESLRRVRQLGTRTGELHLALAAGAEDAAFTPEPFSSEDARQLADAIRASAAHLAGSNASVRALAPLIEARAARLAASDIRAAKIRTHGDYHLGQALDTGSDFVILDFEGEPSRSLAERRGKRSPLRDVAGMLRSFHYAAHAALVDRADRPALEPWAERWSHAASRIFIEAWSDTTRGAAFLPESPADAAQLLDAYLLEKALYEVTYELNNRPAWLPIPLRGLARVLEAEG